MSDGPSRGAAAPTVVIFGATVAGLTAAQRLAERGFRVTVLRARGDDSLPEDLEGLPWTQAAQVQTFAERGPAFRRSSPLPPATQAPPLLRHFRHLRAVLADIPETPTSKSKKKLARSVLNAAIPRPWTPLQKQDQPWVVFGGTRPETAEQFIESAKYFLTAGYTIPDGQTFVARVLRFLTSSDQRRAAECEGVTMLDYLRGASLASTPRFNYGARFLGELQELPELSLGIRPSRDEARVALGWYAQWLADVSVAPQEGSFEFASGIDAGWIRPWLAHLRTLQVRILQGSLHHLELGTDTTGKPKNKNDRQTATTVRAVLARGCDPAARASVKDARYLLIATPAPRAERACSALPSVGVPGALRGFTTSEPVGRTRWRRRGEIHLFLRHVLNLSGPLMVAQSPWRLLARPQHVFTPRAPTVTRDGFASVLSVEIQDWDVPSSTTRKSAAACDDRELAHEVWSQLQPALTTGHKSKPPVCVWFMVGARPGLRSDDDEQPRSPTLNVLPGDWARRPGPALRPTAGETTPPQPPLWAPDRGGTWLHWDRVVFAGDYLKTLTRLPGPEAACESALHAVNTLLAHAARHKAGPPTPPLPVWDPEDHEPPAFAALRSLDAWCCAQGLPHIFEITGLDGWLGIASWLSHLSPATESFLKSVVDLGRTFARAPSGGPAPEKTSFQELGLDVLRRMREALEKRVQTPVTSSTDTRS